MNKMSSLKGVKSIHNSKSNLHLWMSGSHWLSRQKANDFFTDAIA